MNTYMQADDEIVPNVNSLEVLGGLLSNYKIEKNRKTERGELLKEFVSKVNLERGKYKPLTMGRMAMMLKHINNQDLYFFLSCCNDSKNRSGSFGKYFWWALKVK